MKKKVCIHFDINKTLIVNDSATGRGLHASLYAILTECVWGYYPADKPIDQCTAHDWVPMTDKPSTTPPHPDAITFGNYLEEKTLLSKHERRNIRSTFTNSGESGERYKEYADQLLTIMSLSERDRDLCTKQGMECLSSGYYHIFPAFFRFLDYITNERDKDLDCRIVLRTFGNDSSAVINELNMYFTGNHPLFKPSRKLDGSDPLYPYDFRLTLPYSTATNLRTNSGESGMHFAHVDANKCIGVISGAKKVYDYLMFDWLGFSDNSRDHGSRSNRCIAIRDDYGWWEKNDESDDSGKVLLIDRSTSPENSYHIFQVKYNLRNSHDDD